MYFNSYRTNQKKRAILTRVGFLIHSFAVFLLNFSRRFIRFINSHLTNEKSDYFIYRQLILHKQIKKILNDQKKYYTDYVYFYGYLCQSLGLLNIYGERGTEERFVKYRIGNYLKSDDRLLDVGCNCGFMSLYTTFRTGCRSVGIDINPYPIAIGNLCADYLDISNKVHLKVADFNTFHDDEPFTVIFNFATH